MTAKKKTVKSEKEQETKLIKMVREDGKTADVHPDEVDNMRPHGWTVKTQ